MLFILQRFTCYRCLQPLQLLSGILQIVEIEWFPYLSILVFTISKNRWRIKAVVPIWGGWFIWFLYEDEKAHLFNLFARKISFFNNRSISNLSINVVFYQMNSSRLVFFSSIYDAIVKFFIQKFFIKIKFY